MTGHVAVVGAGRMGEGIALALLRAGRPLTLVDVKERTVEERRRQDDGVLTRLAEALRADAGSGAALDQLTLGGRGVDLSGAAVVFEAVPEVLEVKRDVLDWLVPRIPGSCVIASTTSTFLVTDIAAIVVGPERVVNAHWLNPADLMPLVEVSRADTTDPEAVARLTRLLESIGKVPVVCGPAPGYVVPRLQALVMNEAARMVQEGVASAADIDLAVRTGLGPRFTVLGPLEFTDWGGGDILSYASHYLQQHLGERFRPAELVEQQVADGRRGLRDGAGFYVYDDPDAVASYRATRRRELEDLFALRRAALGEGARRRGNP